MLREELVRKLREEGMTCSFAESLTGGMISSGLVGVPGSSEVFPGAVVSYSADIKHSVLGVPRQVIEEDGVVSEKCAIYMAQGVRKLMNSDYAVSVTGVAGPGGGTPDNPVGTVWLGFASSESVFARKLQLSGTRNEIREKTCECAYSEILKQMNMENNK